MLLYSLLHLTGYDLPISELERFRQWGSKTPGHPENHLTPGVEMATGPLGQGFATGVGMAIAERFLAATFNRDGAKVVDHYTYAICSDGDLMEGIASEAASLAGHLKLGKLIYLYDDNEITIDGRTSITFTEDVAARFDAYGWHTQRVDGLDVEAVDLAIRAAQRQTERPSLILCKTVIGFGSPNKADTSKVHGSPLGPEEVDLTKDALGIPREPKFYVADEVRAAFGEAITLGLERDAAWRTEIENLRSQDPALAQHFEMVLQDDLGTAWVNALPTFTDKLATRASGKKVLEAIAPHLPTLFAGSADLGESTFTVFPGQDQQADSPGGRLVNYGIREHAMAAAMNGITLHGGCRAIGGTFLIFSDYCRPSVRLAALMGCPSIFVFTHDSIGVGEDGPTHQPIEQLASLRAIPNLNVMRPCDGNEVSACYKAALELKDAPSLLALSRQNLPAITPDTVENHPAEKGAYVLRDAELPAVILVASGSEVSLAMTSAIELESRGVATRVVSFPSWFLFAKQSADYQASVLPKGTPTVSIEAGSTFGWARYAHAHVGIDHFGASAPGDTLMKEFGFTVEKVVETAIALVR